MMVLVVYLLSYLYCFKKLVRRILVVYLRYGVMIQCMMLLSWLYFILIIILIFLVSVRFSGGKYITGRHIIMEEGGKRVPFMLVVF